MDNTLKGQLVAHDLYKNAVKVLVVEDNQEYADTLQHVLGEANHGQFKSVHADRLHEALEYLKRDPFDAILLDLTLPDSIGHKTFRQVSAYAPHIPIVVFTGLDDTELALQAVREGAQDYLVKGETDVNSLVRSLLYAIERHQARIALQDLSFRDELTGLLNRRGFFVMGEKLLLLALRESWNLIMFFFDLDDLKVINDRHGHQAGDQALMDVARILTQTFRSSDLIARLGGDEFLVLAVKTNGFTLESTLRRLQKNIDAYNLPERKHRLSVSFGLSEYLPQSNPSLEELIAIADRELYVKKSHK